MKRRRLSTTPWEIRGSTNRRFGHRWRCFTRKPKVTHLTQLKRKYIMSTGSRIVEAALEKVGQRYVYGAEVPLNDPDWNGPWDCAEFCCWSVFQVSGILFGTRNNNYTLRNAGDPATADSYTGFWDEDSREFGIRISVDEAARTVGAMVLRTPTRSRGGHIAISDGRGGTIEAKGARFGVVTDTISGRSWDIGVLVPGILYDQPSAGRRRKSDEYRAPARLLQVTTPPTRGKAVDEVQPRLTRLGYSSGPIDGIFGPKTEAAVTVFQIDQGITVDGVVGNETRAALFPIHAGAEIDPTRDDRVLVGRGWECSDGWRITGYYTPHERDYPRVELRTIRVAGTRHSFPDAFIRAVRMEGWGRTSDGWCLGYYGNRYHREREPLDSAGRALEQGVVAVDPRLIQRGVELKIEGVPALAGRVFTARDVGGAIQDRRVDVYCGEGATARAMTYSVTTDGTVVCTLS